MSLRLLLSDEVSNIALQLRKLIGTKHPLLGTAKALLYDEKQSVQTRGLVVLLLSKTFGPPSATIVPDQHSSSSSSSSPISSMSMVSGIYASQRTIAELVEVVYTADLIHRGLLDLKERSDFQVSVAKDIEFANRMAVLAGDFLLANACTGLARLGSTRVVQLIANAISNLMEARFIHDGSDRGNRQNVENVTVDLSLENWEKKTYLGVASLLAKACEAAMEVVGHSEEVQIHAREFGQNLAFAQQIKSEIDQFSDDDQKDSFKLLSAPVVLHVRQQQQQQQRESVSSDGVAALLPVVTSTADDRTAMFEAVRSGPGIQMAKELGHHHRREALAKLEHLPDTESKAALTNIINSISCVS